MKVKTLWPVKEGICLQTMMVMLLQSRVTQCHLGGLNKAALKTNTHHMTIVYKLLLLFLL